MHPKIESAIEIVQRMDGLLASILYAVDSITIEAELPAPSLTDFKVIKVDRDYLETCSVDDLAFVLAHEAGHIIGRHDLRRGGRDAMRWNVSCDKAINRANSKRLTYSKMDDIPVDNSAIPLSEEELYEEGEGKGQKGKSKDGKGEGKCKGKDGEGGGKGKDGGGESGSGNESGECKCWVPRDNSAATEAVSRRVQAVVARAQRAGNGHGLLAHIKPEDARLPLPNLVANILSRGREDYSFRRPSRYSRISGCYLPALSTQYKAGTVMIAVDTSGSMSNAHVSRAIGGILRQARAAKMARLVVVQQDAGCEIIYDGPPTGYRNQNPMKRDGGTDFRPLMKLAGKVKPNLLVVISDLDGPHGESPHCPVLWLTESPHYKIPPFGRVCRVKD